MIDYAIRYPLEAILIVTLLLCLVVLFVLMRNCPSCGYSRIVCLFGCDEVNERLDRMGSERVEVVRVFSDIGKAMDYVRDKEKYSAYPHFYRCRDGKAEVCRVVRT